VAVHPSFPEVEVGEVHLELPVVQEVPEEAVVPQILELAEALEFQILVLAEALEFRSLERAAALAVFRNQFL